jgi:hypothetical protein
MNNKDFIGINWGTKDIDFRNKPTSMEMMPIEVHLKEDGTKDNGPSLCIVMSLKALDLQTYGQISVEMFNEGLKDIGYKLVKI